MKITIIGAGNIGGAIVRGLLNKKAITESDLTIVDVSENVLEQFKSFYPNLNTSIVAKDAINGANIVILAVKPWLVGTLLESFASKLNKEQIFVSIAAGIDFEFIGHYVKEIPSFRVMPNTAISIGESMTLISSKNATKAQEEIVMNLFQKIGKTILIAETMMGPATSVASCGIAYALRYLRAAAEGAVELGFKADDAHQIVAQTMKGAAELILQNHSHPEVEIDKVCTPKGWTIKGLNEMEAYGFTDAVIKGLKVNE